MFKQSRKAVLSAALVSSVFAGCNGATFDPSGNNWTISYDRAEAFSTYITAPAINVSIPVEELVSPPPPATTGVVVAYDATNPNQITVEGMVLALDANRTAVISEMDVALPVPGCDAHQYQRMALTFTGADGHTVEYRMEEGFTFSGAGCVTALQMAKDNITATGMIPSDLEQVVFMGGLRIATLEQATSFGYAVVLLGEHGALSEEAGASAASSSLSTLDFSSFAAPQRAARTWNLIQEAARGNVQPLVDAYVAARAAPQGI